MQYHFPSILYIKLNADVCPRQLLLRLTLEVYRGTTLAPGPRGILKVSNHLPQPSEPLIRPCYVFLLVFLLVY